MCVWISESQLYANYIYISVTSKSSLMRAHLKKLENILETDFLRHGEFPVW